MIKLAYYALFLLINFVFIILTLRACYFLFVIKKDPINTLNFKGNINFLEQIIKKNTQEQERQKFS